MRMLHMSLRDDARGAGPGAPLDLDVYCPAYARCSIAMSSFFICIIASPTRLVFAPSLSANSLPSTVGTTCQETPYLSFSQPHCTFCPPVESLSHSSSISCCVSQFTTKDIDSLNLNCGPPLSARNFCPSSSNETVITLPACPGVPSG